MEITPPFGYQEVKAFNRHDYVRYSTPEVLPPFVKATAVVPLGIGEIVPAAWHYPLVFVRDSLNERVGLVAMLGLTAGENLFHTASGWKTDTYLPAYVRRYPFCMAKVTVNGRVDPDLLVCVEKDYVVDHAKEGYRQLFNEAGEGTEEWRAIEEFLRAYESDLEQAHAFCARMVELDLLEPLTATITQPGKESWNVTGFLGINEEKLNQLASETILELHRNGWLARAYLHLFSLQRLQKLLNESA